MTSQWPRRRPLFARPTVRQVAPPQKKWRLHTSLWGLLKRVCMGIGAMVLLSAMFSCTLIGSAMRDGAAGVTLPEQMVLHLPIETDYPEYKEFAYGPKVPTMREVTAALATAQDDDRVKAVVATLRGGALNMAHLYELRQAVQEFRASGKPAYFYVTSFAEQGQGIGSYYLAAAFDEIWMQPVGALSIPGMKAEVPYARGLLEKVGVVPDIFARKEYKNVFESFTAESMSEPSREMMTAIIGDIAYQLRSDIAADREIATTTLQELVDRGLILDREALEAGLVDVLDYSDTLIERIRSDITGKPDSKSLKFVDINSYVRHHPSITNVKGNNPPFPVVTKDKENKKTVETAAPKIALIYAVGAIVPHMTRADMPGVFMGGQNISATDMSRTFNEAIDDKNVKVIVLRLDSPGGSPSASETLRAKILRAQAKGKKVVISMGETAASGGYWMAAPADYIFATPLTLTGSIGVAGGKFVLAGLWEKVGVNWDSVEWGANAGLLSANEPYNEAQRARYAAMMDNVYDSFIARVAEGRKMDPVQAELLARGRVWTGRQARQKGLVDEIGSLDDALDYAARLAGAEDRHGVQMEILPKPETAWERLARFLEMQAGIGQWFSTMAGRLHIAASGDHLTVYEEMRLR